MALHRYLATLVILILASPTLLRTYKQIYDETCTSDGLKNLDISEEERVKKRDSLISTYVSVPSVASFVQTKEIKYLAKEAGSYLILMIILTALCLGSFVFYLMFCCCKRAKSASRFKSQAFCFISIAPLVTFLALFIVMLVYLGKMNINRMDTSCGVASVPNNFIDGVNTNTLKFLGLKTLFSVLTDFKSEISNLQGLGPVFSSILNSGIVDLSSQALASLPTFYQKYANSTTLDGTGVQNRPLTVRQLTPKINPQIEKEFATYDEVSEKLLRSAAAGRNLLASNSLNDVQNTIQMIINELKNLTSDVTDNFSAVIDTVDYFDRYSPIGYWITLGFGIVMVIASIAAMILAFYTVKKITDRYRLVIKIIIAVIGFFSFLMGIIAIVMLVGTIGLGSVCQAAAGILNANDIKAEIKQYQLKISPFVENVLINCLPLNSTGDLTNLFTNGTDVYAQTTYLLDGVTFYRDIQAAVVNQTSLSPAIKTTTDQWENYRVSIFADHDNIKPILDQLNDLVICGDYYFAMNEVNCTDANCQGLYNTTSFKPPSCSQDQTQAATLYQRLKEVATQQDTLLTAMQKDLNGPSSSAPLTLQNNLKAKLNELNPILNDLSARLQKTTQFSRSFQQGFAKNMNCTVLRKALNDIETTLCFSFNVNLYYFVCLLCFVVLSLLMMAWALWLMLFCTPKMLKGTEVKRETPVSTLFVTEEERDRLQ